MSQNNDETCMNDDEEMNDREFDNNEQKPEKMFTLKKWNAVAMWSWDVECDTCAICRVQVMGKLFSSAILYILFIFHKYFYNF